MKKLFFLMIGSALTSQVAQADICGNTDDRIPSQEPRVARFTEPDQFSGCAATLISKNCIVTTGSCATRKENAEFNVPPSIAGIPQRSSAEDTYTIDYGFMIASRGGVSEEWAVTKLSPNPITGKSAGEVQGYFKLASGKPRKNDQVKVVQYAYALSDAPYVVSGKVSANPFEDILHYAQSSSHGVLNAGLLFIPGILEYRIDTSYGASGAPIINTTTDELIGVNSHGGCTAKKSNAGTSVWGSKAFKKAIKACLDSDH